MDILIFSILISLIIVCAIVSLIGMYIGRTFKDSLFESSNLHLLSIKDIGKVLLIENGLSDVRIKWKKGGDNCFILNKNKIQINKKYKSVLTLKGIATICHETGHAILYNSGFPPSILRHTLPQYYSDPFLMFLYIIFSYIWIYTGLVYISIGILLLFSVTSIMILIDEWKATSKGLKELEKYCTVSSNKCIKRMRIYLFSCWCTYLSNELIYFQWMLLLIFFMWLLL